MDRPRSEQERRVVRLRRGSRSSRSRNDLKSARRNAFVRETDRDKLVIDPGPRIHFGANQRSAPFDTGNFWARRSISANSERMPQARLDIPRRQGAFRFPFAWISRWSPLPTIRAGTTTRRMGRLWRRLNVGGVAIPVDPAWVVTAPPNYSPDLVTPQTMYDVITDALAGSLLNVPAEAIVRQRYFSAAPPVQRCAVGQFRIRGAVWMAGAQRISAAGNPGEAGGGARELHR